MASSTDGGAPAGAVISSGTTVGGIPKAVFVVRSLGNKTVVICFPAYVRMMWMHL